MPDTISHSTATFNVHPNEEKNGFLLTVSEDIAQVTKPDGKTVPPTKLQVLSNKLSAFMVNEHIHPIWVRTYKDGFWVALLPRHDEALKIATWLASQGASQIPNRRPN